MENETIDWTRLLDEIEARNTLGDDPMLPLAEDEMPAAPLPSQHVKGSRFDAYLFEQALEQTPVGAAVEAGVKAGWEQTPELAADLRNALLKHEPQVQDVREEYAKNAQALDTALGMPEFEQMRALTVADEFNTALATAQFTKTLVETLLKQEEEEKEEEGQPEPEQGGGDGDESGQPSPEEREQARQKQQQQRQEMGLRVAARAAAGAAQKEVKKASALAQAFGGGEDQVGGGWGMGQGAAGSVGNIGQRAQLAKQVAQQPRLQQIADLAGRMKVIAANAQRQRAEHIPDEIADIERGDNLARMLPLEMLNMVSDETEDLFWMRLLDHGLTQYALTGEESAKRGPIIFCADESGSMSGYPSDWTAAIGLALLSIAAKQHRDFVWVHFGGKGEIKKDEYLRGKGTPEQVMASALHFFAGGTDYDAPLMLALTAIAIEHGQYNKADVVFVTDGLCQVSNDILQEWLRIKREKQFRCYGMLIGYPGQAGALKAFCDAVTDVTPGQQDGEVLFNAFSV
jgi:uncharacterized protein with von Willebrand factor type A (vWA) domain